MEKNKFYKYSLKVRWPAMCRNRSTQILKERPDLVEQMSRFREKISNVLYNTITTKTYSSCFFKIMVKQLIKDLALLS